MATFSTVSGASAPAARVSSSSSGSPCWPSPAVGYAVGHGTLSSAVSIPGTATAQVTDQLRDALPAASGGSGTVVFHTADGSPFTDQQRRRSARALKGAGSVPGVRAVTDPFETAGQLAAQQQQVDTGRTQLAAGTAQLQAGQAQLDQARQQLDAARAQAQQAGAPVPQQVVDGLAQLDAQQQVLAQKKAEATAQGTKLELGASLLDLSRGIRTVAADNSAAIGIVAFEGGQMEVPPEVEGRGRRRPPGTPTWPGSRSTSPAA